MEKHLISPGGAHYGSPEGVRKRDSEHKWKNSVAVRQCGGETVKTSGNK